MMNVSIFSLSLLLLSPALSLHAADTTAAESATAPASSPIDGNQQAAAIASKVWLELVDKDHYDQSWTEASNITKNTVSQKEWNKILTKTRKPLGEMKSRDMVDERTAVNPKKAASRGLHGDGVQDIIHK